jgi:hypothetical protein
MPRVRPRGYSRAAIERIRATIDTKAAIKELHQIGHDPNTPAGVRVKALSVLLDKTMPSLTERDLHVTHHEAPPPAEMVSQLLQLLGRDAVAQRWPDLLLKYDQGQLAQIATPLAGESVRIPSEDHAEDQSEDRGSGLDS